MTTPTETAFADALDLDAGDDLDAILASFEEDTPEVEGVPDVEGAPQEEAPEEQPEAPQAVDNNVTLPKDVVDYFMDKAKAAETPVVTDAPAEPARDIFTELLADTNLSDEEAKMYAASLPIIEKRARAQAIEIVRQVLDNPDGPLARRVQEYVAPVAERVQSAEATSASARSQQVYAQVSQEFPWLSEAVNTKSYQSYLQEVVPGTGLARGYFLQNAVNAGDVASIGQILTGYKAPAAPTRGSVTPGTAKPNPQAGDSPKRVFKSSTYSKALQMLQRGELTPDQFSKVEDRYYQAMAEGTLVEG